MVYNAATRVGIHNHVRLRHLFFVTPMLDGSSAECLSDCSRRVNRKGVSRDTPFANRVLTYAAYCARRRVAAETTDSK